MLSKCVTAHCSEMRSNWEAEYYIIMLVWWWQVRRAAASAQYCCKWVLILKKSLSYLILENWCISYLKFKLGAAEVGPLLLPKVVRFNYEGNVDAGRKRLLQDLQERFDAVPLGTTHIHDDSEAMFTDLLAGMDGGQREWEELKDQGREGKRGGRV